MAFSLIFFLMVVIPGDFADFIAGFEANPYERELLRKQYGLDRPVYERYFSTIVDFLQGRLGTSFTQVAPVEEAIVPRLPITFLLATFSLILSVSIAIPMGILAAVKRGTKTDLAVSTVAFAGLSIPVFWFALIVLLVFGAWFHVIPTGKFSEIIRDPYSNINTLFFPSLVNGLILAAPLTRMARSSMLEVLLHDYIRTARAKGLQERIVIYKHALRNAIIPVLTVAGFIFAGLLAGAVIVEEVFQIPGLGSFMLRAVGSRDHPLVQGIVVVVVLLAILINFIVDALYGIIDPRVRY